MKVIIHSSNEIVNNLEFDIAVVVRMVCILTCKTGQSYIIAKEKADS